MCGGTPARLPLELWRVGLSPRVRGNLARRSFSPTARRSIPACAGEPPRLGIGNLGNGVYPRVCGGTRGVDGVPRNPTGLSPRVRGNRVRMAQTTPAQRSIPACAGEPIGLNRPLPVNRVYPRVCGGTRLPDAVRLALGGLSPRVRGNRLPRLPRPTAYRSIPACAGEPNLSSVKIWRHTVYPRVCGGTW